MESPGITAIAGIRVGHYTDLAAATGCTVVLCEGGAMGGVDVRGSAPGTRGTDALRPTFLNLEVHGVLLSGGSAFGLDAAGGVMRYLEERGVGALFGGARIPVVPAAILFDLGVITSKVRPGLDEGYAACDNAASGPVEEGSVGAGTGATVAKLMGRERAIKGGIGTACIALDGGLLVGAIVAVNAVGGVYEPETGAVVAGPRKDDGRAMYDVMRVMTMPGFTQGEAPAPVNTTIGVVATNARLNKEQANKLAAVAHDGLALAVRPAHLMSDGDTMFALATGELSDESNMNQLCAATVACVGSAIVRGVQKARGLGGFPAVSELG
ncbi:MAG: P1 family peptidase [Chloroflexi bacterium]|nr:P1 family peptidase [Chloroflexota bacterium]